MIEELEITGLLSFGETPKNIKFNKGLNVLIGANGSGKSNLIEIISLLQATPKNLRKTISDGGGIQAWLWKGKRQATEATLQTIITNSPKATMSLRHILSFSESRQGLEIKDERIENKASYEEFKESYFYYKYQNGSPVLNVRDLKSEGNATFERKLSLQDIDIQQSIISQRKDPEQYPEITYLGQQYSDIKLYRDWQFGRRTAPRLPQPADLPNKYLEENLTNLGLILNKLRKTLDIKKRLVSLIQELSDGIEDFELIIEGNTVQIFFQDAYLNTAIPATRLSDGTLRFLCLLVILLHPEPPPLICIEEPELGLHPDVLPVVSDLLKEAGERTQLIITTHSADLIDELSDMPEAVLVCEKIEGATQINRLNPEELSIWLKDYSLGKLWQRGDIGGNRW